MPVETAPNREHVALLFVRDLSAINQDRLYLVDDVVTPVNAKELVASKKLIICHDFWAIRDFIFNEAGTIPKQVIDLEEFRMSTSGDPNDRLERERRSI